MNRRSVDIQANIPNLVKLQDLISTHKCLTADLLCNMREMEALSLKINLQIKEDAAGEEQ